jgi:hypothetical protein
MQCAEFEDRLNAVLDERRRPEWDDEVRLHVESCPDCRRIARSYDDMLDGFCALTAPAAPHDLAMRVLAQWEGPRPAARRARGTLTALAVAAAVVVVVLPMVRVTPGNVARPPRPDGRPALAAVGHAWRSLSPTPSLLDVSAPDPVRYSSLAKETGQSLASMMLYVPGVGGSLGIIDGDEMTAGNESSWAGRMSDGLKPLTQSVTQTFGLLLGPWSPGDGAGRS